MKKLLVATACAALCAGPALAGPKDQTKAPLIGPQAIGGNATVNNTTTAFSYQQKGCTIQVKAKGLTGVADGAPIICIAGADVIAPPTIMTPAGNAIVFVGEAKSGGLSVKANLTEVLCGSTAAVNFNGNLACYLDDPAYRTPGGTWNAACTAQGSTPIPNVAMEPKQLKVNAGQNIVVGLCQNFTTPGTRINPPASALIATQGSYIGVLP